MAILEVAENRDNHGQQTVNDSLIPFCHSSVDACKRTAIAPENQVLPKSDWVESAKRDAGIAWLKRAERHLGARHA
jgi:hypothetical protein